ncbi:MAG: S-layer homology domain-containing protein [Butyricicoccus pullicaecorum]|nr:S-layer homology domain-containing protein [Butyricicoccus pullicaecorum]
MQKKWMRVLSAFALCALLATTSACATPPPDELEVPEEPEQITEQIHTGGMIYIPDRSVYFADVNLGYDWAFHAIDYLANTGVVSGTGNLIYSPAKTLSRADFVLMLYRAYGMEKYASGDNFADVPETAYYAQAVRAARAIGIAVGDSKNNFYPKEPLTRQDAIVLLKRTLDRTGISFQNGDLSKFMDGKQVADYAVESVSALVNAGVIAGIQGKLNPTENITRAEMAVMLYRALHLRAIDGRATYLAQPSMRLVCIGSTIYADVHIKNYVSKTYAGLYHLEQMTQEEDVYTVVLGEPEPIDDTILWDGTSLRVNGNPVAVAPDVEAIAVDMYSKRKAGLCSTGKEYRTGAVSMIDGVVQTVYYKK